MPFQSFRTHFRHSLTAQLLTGVFSLYFLITLGVTIVHMGIEYISTKEGIKQDLAGYYQAFEPTLGSTIWATDWPAVKTLLIGMLKNPTLIGAKVEVGKQRDAFVVGTFLTGQGIPTEIGANGKARPLQTHTLFSEIFGQTYVIKYMDYGVLKEVGHITLYSSRAVVFQKVQYGFMVIVLNAIIKTVALWVIFLWFGRRLLSRPLSILTAASTQLKLENLEHMRIDIGTSARNELSLLEEAFNEMIQKLIFSRRELQEKERLKIELQTAQSVQQLLLPAADPQLEEIEMASFYQSASETGGDWYLFRHYPEYQTLAVLIGDVTGHGVPAAIITGMVESLYEGLEEARLKARELNRNDVYQRHPAYFLEVMNNVLYRILAGRYNMTLCFSVVDLEHKNLVYASAAHNACLVWRPSQFEFTQHGILRQRSILDLHGSGPHLGDLPESTYDVQIQALQKDDVILWYTDGLIENTNSVSEMFGLNRLKKILKHSEGLAAATIRDRIIEAARLHYADFPYADDITLIVGRVL